MTGDIQGEIAPRPGAARRRAAVITPFFADRDAVGNDVFHSTLMLRELGWEARVFAVSGTSARETAHPLSGLAAFLRDPGDLAYYHFSTGRRDVLDAVAALRCRRLLKFHNITPPELFSAWDDEIAEANRIGREEMALVAGMGWEQVLAASEYNLRDLGASLPQGTRTCAIAPFHEADRLLALVPRRPPRSGQPRFLAVGRIVQSKGHPFLLRVMRYLVHELGVRAHLDIVGKTDHRLLAYARMLELMVREFGLDSLVRFHGELDDAGLAARYAEATAFVCTSEHEGFCVPLVEAMAFGVPVVALSTSAIPETVGDAGIVWKERDPRRFALTLERLANDDSLRDWLGELGRARFAARFTNEAIRGRLAAVISGPGGAT